MSRPRSHTPVRLAVTDFGPIAKAEVDLRPLTVFIGPSNTGKSYLAILIYALHSLFPAGAFRRSGGFLRMPRWRRDAILAEDSMQRLGEWVDKMSSDSESGERRKSFDGPLPEELASEVRPILEDASSGDALSEEIARCFGIGSSSKRLIRSGSRRGANIVLQRGPFRFDLALTARDHRFSATIPTGVPLLGSDANIQGLWRLISRAPDRRRFVATNLFTRLAESVMPHVVGELSQPAFYLPADRAGVMHAHRVVVSALVERSASAGLRSAPSIPTLSGVLADFLEQLINLDESERHVRMPGTDFAKDIERDILSGAIRFDLSETRYPSFFYRPQGWKDDLPLLNTSSMVTELAPVVLYLRHLVGRGDTLIIEEPESHLHPEMQAALARQLARLARSGVHVIVTTHSEWLLDQFANLVRMSELDEKRRSGLPGSDAVLRPDQFGAWLFRRKQRPNGSVVEELSIDPDAGGLLSDYGGVADQLYGTWSEIGNRITEGSAKI